MKTKPKTKPALTAPSPPPRLTPDEKLFLRLLQQQEDLQEPFSYQAISKLAGWRDVDTAWIARDGLMRKGYLELGKRLAFLECPIITNSGLAALQRVA